MRQHICLDGVAYPVDSSEEIDVAIAAMRSAGLTQSTIWNGEHGDPGSRNSGTALWDEEEVSA
jgi:hypothetical protein